MPTVATNKGTDRELIEPGNYIARCYASIHIGEIKETINGQEKVVNKVRLSWELPNNRKVFNPEKGEQPYVFHQNFNLSTNEKSNLRKTLESWRGKGFTKEEAESFDVETVVGAPCMLNIIHKPSKDGTKTYEEISSVTPIPSGFTCPPMVNPKTILNYTEWNQAIFDALPDFVKDQIKSSRQYQEMVNPGHNEVGAFNESHPDDDLPF